MGISPDTPERVKARQEREQQIIDEIDPLDLIELVECKLVERLAKQEGTESEFNLYEARFRLRR